MEFVLFDLRIHLAERILLKVRSVSVGPKTLRSVGLLLWSWGFKPSLEPARHLVEAVILSVPKVFKTLNPGIANDVALAETYKIEAQVLIKSLAKDYPGPSPAFAVFRLIERGLLGAEIREYEVPEGDYDGTNRLGGPTECEEFYVVFPDGTQSEVFHSLYGVRRDHRLFVWPKAKLWHWWNLSPEGSPPVPTRSRHAASRKKTAIRKSAKPRRLTAKQERAYLLDGQGKTQKQIGEEMGISRQAAGNLVKKAKQFIDEQRGRSPRAQALPTDHRGQVSIEDDF